MKIFNFEIRRSAKNRSDNNYIGAPSFRYVNPGFYNHYKSEEYASAYPSIRAIANEYMTVMPKAIGNNGQPVQNNPIINALFHPNQLDSVVSFNEKVAVSTLFHRKTYILVWRNEGGEAKPGGDFGFKGSKIAGFTFLEKPAINRRDGKTYYNIGAQEFSENDVMVLPGGVDPHDLYAGYSPSESACRWIKLDDFIADFQSGFFENNAIPAGQFIITAPTIKEFNDIKDMLQDKHRGAGKNNNVTYTHRPVDPNTGKPTQAAIEWIPFQQSNKDIGFKDLFAQANKRIDLAYGVPQIVKGVDDAATYANAQVAEAGFAKRAVYPLLLRNYTQITHELNRITGGIGVAITFDYEIPSIADEEKVKAETKNIEANLIKTMVAEGYSLSSIVDAFNLSKGYKTLALGEKSGGTIENDKAEVDEGDEVLDSPDPERIDGITPVNKGEANRTNPKAQLTDSDTEGYQDRLSIVIREHMLKQIEDAISDLDDANNAVTELEVEQFTDDMLEIITAVMVANGTIQYEEGISLLVAAGISTEGITSFILTEAQKRAYRDYLLNVGQSYVDETAESIRAVLDRANTLEWTRNDLERALRDIMNTDEWRVKRLAISEVNRSQQMGGLHSMEQIQAESGVTVEKVWMTTSTNPCPICIALSGKTKPLGEPFLGEGESISIGEGETFVNNFVAMDVAQAHPNDNCVITYTVKK